MTHPWRRGETGSEGSRQSPRTLVKTQDDWSPQQPAPWDAGWAPQACPSVPPLPNPSPRPRPLGAPRLPSQISHPWWTACPPSSTVRDWPRPRQRLLFESRRRHLPSPRPALRLPLGLLAPRQFLWKLGQPATSTSDLPAGAGLRGRRDCALETEAWASASSLSTQVPGKQGVDIVEVTRGKKRFKDSGCSCFCFLGQEGIPRYRDSNFHFNFWHQEVTNPPTRNARHAWMRLSDWVRAQVAAYQTFLVQKHPAEFIWFSPVPFSDQEIELHSNDRKSPAPPLRSSLTVEAAIEILGVAVVCRVSVRAPPFFHLYLSWY